jgi:hypothetical protein
LKKDVNNLIHSRAKNFRAAAGVLLADARDGSFK